MKRYVDVQTARETPLSVLAALREVHPTAELVYAKPGSGLWWLGYVQNSPAMANVGYDPPKDSRMQYDLQRQGFRFLGEYADCFITAGYLRDEMQFMFGRTDEELEQDYASMEANASGDAADIERERLLAESARQQARSIYAHVFRKRRGVLYPQTPISKS